MKENKLTVYETAGGHLVRLFDVPANMKTRAIIRELARRWGDLGYRKVFRGSLFGGKALILTIRRNLAIMSGEHLLVSGKGWGSPGRYYAVEPDELPPGAEPVAVVATKNFRWTIYPEQAARTATA